MKSKYQASAEHYWDRMQQRVVTVGGRKRSGSDSRRLRRHGAVAVTRMMKQHEAADNRVDKLVRVDRESEDQATRVGDKFLIHD